MTAIVIPLLIRREPDPYPPDPPPAWLFWVLAVSPLLGMLLGWWLLP